MENNTDYQIQILTRLSVIEEKLDGYNKFQEKTDIAFNKSEKNEKDIQEIKDSNKWLIRTVISEIIALVSGAVMLYIKLK